MEEFLDYVPLVKGKLTLKGDQDQKDVAAKRMTGRDLSSNSCVAMASVAIVTSSDLPPEFWCVSTINEILVSGDELYCEIRMNQEMAEEFLNIDDVLHVEIRCEYKIYLQYFKISLKLFNLKVLSNTMS